VIADYRIYPEVTFPASSKAAPLQTGTLMKVITYIYLDHARLASVLAAPPRGRFGPVLEDAAHKLRAQVDPLLAVAKP
jgi:hypothetical protein